MGSLRLNDPEKKVAAEDILIRILEIPSEKCRLLPPICECQYLLSAFWEVLVERVGDDRVRAIRAVDDFADGVGRLVATNSSAGNLVFSFFSCLLLLHKDRRIVTALKLQIRRSNLPTAHTELVALRFPIIGISEVKRLSSQRKKERSSKIRMTRIANCIAPFPFAFFHLLSDEVMLSALPA